jgi:hypothetical protein
LLIAQNDGVCRSTEARGYFGDEPHCLLWKESAMPAATGAPEIGRVLATGAGMDDRDIGAARLGAINAAIEPD